MLTSLSSQQPTCFSSLNGLSALTAPRPNEQVQSRLRSYRSASALRPVARTSRGQSLENANGSHAAGKAEVSPKYDGHRLLEPPPAPPHVRAAINLWRVSIDGAPGDVLVVSQAVADGMVDFVGAAAQGRQWPPAWTI